MHTFHRPQFWLDRRLPSLATHRDHRKLTLVDGRWIVPGINDVGPEKGMAESMYEQLMDAGVRIYEWQEHTMHAKEYLSDNYLMVIGSANLDNLSLFLNYELVTVIYDERLCRRYTEIFLTDLEEH